MAQFLAIALLLIQLVAAQSCWKSTNCSGSSTAAFPGVWDSNIYAPTSRKFPPASILSLQTRNTISNYTGINVLAKNGSSVVLDFGIEVGGLISFNYTSTGAGSIGLAFTESKKWVGEWSDFSNGGFTPDGALYSTFSSAGTYNYTQPDIKLRGGFRYITLFLLTNTSSVVNISNVQVTIGFQPTWSNLRAYQGYFHCSDEELNKIWYSGAYTLQTNSVPVGTGRHSPAIKNSWQNDGVLGPGDTIMVDGAKRDRAVWPGDMGIAVPSTFVSTGELVSVKNSLQVMYDYQNPTTGAFPEAGPPLLQLGSDTYHMWTMIGTYNYVLYTNDTAFLQQNWAKYLLAMDFIYGKVTYQSGLLNVTGLRDWARWQTGYNNSQAQMILYKTLTTGADLASWTNKGNLTTTWRSRAVSLRAAINTYCWNSTYGAFKDNATTTVLYPQDANSMAILFGITNSTSQAQSISTNLLKNWTPIGAETPELPGNISPFISSFEIQAHFTIGQTARALELIRRSWGWYLNHPNGTGSTVIEGYRTDGSFSYRAERGYKYSESYVSHAHGWSAGPTSALTEFVLGLSVITPLGATWRIAPQFGDLTRAEGGFVTGLGKFQTGWKLLNGSYTLSYNVPLGTTGVVVLPYLVAGKFPTVQVNGHNIPKSMRAYTSASGDGVVLAVEGGKVSFAVS